MQQKKESLSYHIGTAAAATLGVHPIRVGLNLASLNPSLMETVKRVPDCLVKGMGFNLVRGALNTGLQSQANVSTQEQFDNSTASKFAGLVAATLTGTIVSALTELPFMRKNAGAKGFPPSLFKCNRAIGQFLMLRELGFSSAVLISKDFSPSAHYSILFTAAWLTAACHKLAMIEATKTYKTQAYTIPDYAKGMKQAMVQISKGVYTHPALRVPNPNPSSFFQHTTNLLQATCGPNMFFWRLVYLKAFSELLSVFKKQVDNSCGASNKVKNH